MLRLINDYAEKGMLLKRTEESLLKFLPDFSVAEIGGEVVGCGALSQLGPGLGEIRSIAVRADQAGKGIGHVLVDHLYAQAESRGFQEVLALTRRVNFFEKLGFEVSRRERFLDKLMVDCAACPMNLCCDETAVVKPVHPHSTDETHLHPATNLSADSAAPAGVASGVTVARGFRAAAVEAGIKTGRTDLALIVSDRPCTAAGVFTSNLAKAAPVLVSAEHLGGGVARAIVANAGCANAATGEQGLRAARDTAQSVAAAIGCATEEVVVASTGVIGVHLDMEKIARAIPQAVHALGEGNGHAAARAIMTTDTKPKESHRAFDVNGVTVNVGGMAKGAGMIAPDLVSLHATMLAFFTTDAAIDRELLTRALIEAVGTTFNRITVDSDTSTNDTAVVLANGASGATIHEGPSYDAFRDALRSVSRDLALMMARDGEGVQRICEVIVRRAPSVESALKIARTIADSPLCKTALHGGDPNWGRILAAAGRAGVPFDANHVNIHIGDVFVCEAGAARNYSEAEAHTAMMKDPGRIVVDLNSGTAEDSVWMCDLTRDYVDINAHYRS